MGTQSGLVNGDSFFHTCQPPIELIGKLLPIAGGKARRTSHHASSTWHFINHIPHRVSLAHVCSGKQLTLRIERLGTFAHDIGSQGNVEKVKFAASL